MEGSCFLAAHPSRVYSFLNTKCKYVIVLTGSQMKDANWNEISKSQINYCLKYSNLLSIFCMSEEVWGPVDLAKTELPHGWEGEV